MKTSSLTSTAITTAMGAPAAVATPALLDLVRKGWRGWPQYLLAFDCAVALNIIVPVLLLSLGLERHSVKEGEAGYDVCCFFLLGGFESSVQAGRYDRC